MTAHVHFDTQALRAHMTAQADSLSELAMAKTRDDRDRLYVKTQRMLSNAAIELMAQCAEAENAGTSGEMIFRSAVFAMGKMAHSLSQRYENVDVVDIINGMIEGMNLAQSQPNNDDFTSVSTDFSPMQSGRA